MEIVNLNKHVVNVRINGQDIVFPGTETPATVAVKSIQDGEANGIPVYRSEYGEVQNLPAPKNGVFYLVNMLVGTRAALEGRVDLIGPDSGPTAIRYQDGPRKGQIEAVTQFVRY